MASTGRNQDRLQLLQDRRQLLREQNQRPAATGTEPRTAAAYTRTGRRPESTRKNGSGGCQDGGSRTGAGTDAARKIPRRQDGNKAPASTGREQERLRRLTGPASASTRSAAASTGAEPATSCYRDGAKNSCSIYQDGPEARVNQEERLRRLPGRRQQDGSRNRCGQEDTKEAGRKQGSSFYREGTGTAPAAARAESAGREQEW